MTSHLKCASLFAVLTICARGDTYPRQPGVDVVHYSFRITLSDATDEINGDATVEAHFLHERVSEFALDLSSHMTVTEVNAANEPAKYTHTLDKLRIALSPTPRAGELRKFTVRYHGVPKAGLRIGTNKYGERTFYSENWPDKARQWLPMVDHPYDKATSEFYVIAPIKYQAVSNGLLIEQTDRGDGTRLTHWKQDVPIASWLNAIGVGQLASRHFGTAHDIPLETWVFHQDRDAGITTFERPVREAMEFYIDHIGPFPYQKLGNVEAAGLNGGTEHASAIFYGEKSVTGKPATNLVEHEIAHQWFGDSVTEKDWDDVWLSEGFATYFTLLTNEHYQGRDAFVAGLQLSRAAVLALEKKLPGVPVIHNNLSDMTKVLNRIIYEKGGWTLHMLRCRMGDDAFWAGIRDYYSRYRDRNVSTGDFRAVMEERAGGSLKEFFDQWLHRAGSPVLGGSWGYDAASKKLTVEIEQTQPGEPYRLPVEIGFRTQDGLRIERVELTGRRGTLTVAAGEEPAAVVLDPQTRLLADLRPLSHGESTINK